MLLSTQVHACTALLMADVKGSVVISLVSVRPTRLQTPRGQELGLLLLSRYLGYLARLKAVLCWWMFNNWLSYLKNLLWLVAFVLPVSGV